jgi:chromosome partitioning protein
VSVNANPQPPLSAHVVVLGGRQGGRGTSTIAMHVAIALLNRGQRVATVDLDTRHASLTRYIENRRAGAGGQTSELALPVHFSIADGGAYRLVGDEALDVPALTDAIARIALTHDFIVIDASTADRELMRLVCARADTLITPIENASGMPDAGDQTASASGADVHVYSGMVRKARERRRSKTGASIDWVVVCNRLASPHTRSSDLNELAAELGFRCIDGLAERPLYRDLFLRGLTALDRLDDSTLGVRPSLAHATAQREAISLISELMLPLAERDRPDAPGGTQWLAAPPIVPLGERDLLGT